MAQVSIIRLPQGGKAHIHIETHRAIRKGCRVLADDRAVAAYAAAPHEGVTPEIVSAVRATMIRNGEISRDAYSRRDETPPLP